MALGADASVTSGAPWNVRFGAENSFLKCVTLKLNAYQSTENIKKKKFHDLKWLLMCGIHYQHALMCNSFSSSWLVVQCFQETLKLITKYPDFHLLQSPVKIYTYVFFPHPHLISCFACSRILPSRKLLRKTGLLSIMEIFRGRNFCQTTCFGPPWSFTRRYY